MEKIENILDNEMIWKCLGRGLKAVDIANYLGVSKTSITKVLKGEIKALKQHHHQSLYRLYELSKCLPDN